MECIIRQLQSNPTTMVIAATMVIISFFFFFCYSYLSRRRYAGPPEVGGAWPLIGHLHLLAGGQPPHMILGSLADKYGPIFTLKFGVHRTLVISNSELAKECLTTHDKAFANRPTALALETLGYTLLGFAHYGPVWRTLRKIAVQEILSAHRLHLVRSVRASEVNASIEDIHRRCREASDNKIVLDMTRWFGDITLNVIFRIMIGRPVMAADEEGEICRQRFREYVELAAGKFAVSDALPYLRWLDVGGFEKAMKKTMKDLDGVLQTWLEEHKEKRSNKDHKEDEDFMDMMISVVEDQVHQELSGYDANTLIKATCLGLIIAASDTSALTMTWCLSLLVNHPDKLRKCQQELDNQVGRERQVQETDMKSLTYLKAVMKETLRLYPVAPLLVPHESMEDRTVGGYHVPAGTQIMINAWKIQNDPVKWPNPFEFSPERFLTTHKDVDVMGQNFELIPFGSGRRMCPGTNFALEVMQFAMATLLHGFEISNPSSEPVDMREGKGIAYEKATPLEVFLKPRLWSF